MIGLLFLRMLIVKPYVKRAKSSWFFQKSKSNISSKRLSFGCKVKQLIAKSAAQKKRERKARIKQAQACLADLLPKLNRKDEAQLQEVICAYSEMESVKKVKEYSDILKKLRAAYDIK